MTTEAENIAFFEATTAAVVRALPMADALRFLHGALVVCGDHAAVANLRRAYIGLHESAAQLELIAGPQRLLNLGGQPQ